jgi:hypothetical protein
MLSGVGGQTEGGRSVGCRQEIDKVVIYYYIDDVQQRNSNASLSNYLSNYWASLRMAHHSFIHSLDHY